jgi:predicted phosphodiesterase
MKILIYSDIHISQDSSIVKSFGEKYSTRLEHIIKSLDWAEDLALKEHCEAVFNLGDTFDKPIIQPMEATAVQDIKWNNLPHYILVGNHDSNVESLEYSSVSILKKLGFNIITETTHLNINNVDFTFIPYITNDNRKQFKEYIKSENDIVLSHNDIAGFNFGRFISKDGFDIKDIEKNCRLYLNGHLHNSSFLSSKILNVGNLCGQNFTENSFKYKHGSWILDTDNLSLNFYENPYALNFYNIEYKEEKDLNTIKNNSVLQIKCERKNNNKLKENLDRIKDKIIATRVLLYDVKSSESFDTSIKLEKVDYIKQFIDFIHDKVGDTDLVNFELQEICK